MYCKYRFIQLVSELLKELHNNMSISESEILPHVELQIGNSAFGRRIREFDLINFGYRDIEQFLLNAFDLYKTQIVEAVRQFHLIKTVSYFCADFERSFQSHEDSDSDPIVEKRLVYIPTKVIKIDSTTNLNEHFRINIIDYVLQKIDEVLIEGSGFTLSKINKLTVQVFKHEPMRGSGFIKLPRLLKNKKAVLNLKNTQDECFKWAILSALHHHEVHARKAVDAMNYGKWQNELNFDGIDFPVELKQIKKFMEQNDGLAINVYYFDAEKKLICPLFLANKPIDYRYIHLLLLTETAPQFGELPTDEVNTDSHFCWIKNLNALVGAQISKHGHKIHMCDRCLNHFNSPTQMEQHKILCAKLNECAIEMPCIEDKFETFKNFKNELKSPFILYADTETLMMKPETSVFDSDCSTKAHNQHEVHSIGYFFKSENDELRSRYASHRGANCLEWFMDELTDIAIEVFDFLDDRKCMVDLSDDEKKSFLQSTNCHICKKSFIDEDITEKLGVRVRDHCHLTGAFRGAAHNLCNLQYQITRNIPIVMHNLSGYDSHLLIRKLACEELIPGKITIIPNNAEKYISFIKTMYDIGQPFREIKFKFIDSLRFMTASLDYLASILPQEKKVILKSECLKSGYSSDEMINLLNRKGVFPYEYIDSYEKLNERMLPSQEDFYSMLTESNVSDEDYIHAQNVWQKFGLQTLGEYSDLYLKTDVLLLADVFENFRSTCHATYALDPAHYFGAPGLSFDAMLKYTNVSIELFTAVDMLMFAERGIRGGVSQINKRYVRANNMYMGDEFDVAKETSYIIYLDGKFPF